MTTRIRQISLVVVAVLLVGTAGAQDKSTYYTVQHPSEFAIDWKGFYDRADQLTADVRKTLPTHLDLAYGTDAKQKLDVYQPTGERSSLPVFIFLHGGGFREGDRAHYGYVAKPLAANGIVTVVASYRLLPGSRYPDQLDDTRRVVAWVHEHIARYGGDPARIYLGGHSAGAMLTAQACASTAWLSALSIPATALRGCAPVSGSYDLESRTSDYVVDARRAEASPLRHIVAPAPRWVIAVGSNEASTPPIRPEDSETFGARLREKHARADVLVLDGLDHSQTVAAFGDEGSPLVRAILEMIRQTARPGSRP